MIPRDLPRQIVAGLLVTVAVAFIVGRVPALRSWINRQWKATP